MARYQKRNQPSKNNPSIFVEKMSNRRAIESDEEKKVIHRKLIDSLGKSRDKIREKKDSGSSKRLPESGKKKQMKKEEAIKSLEAWIVGYEDAKLKLIKKGKHDEAKNKDKDIQRIQEEIDKLKGIKKSKKQLNKHDEIEDDKMDRLRKCVGMVEDLRKVD